MWQARCICAHSCMALCSSFIIVEIIPFVGSVTPYSNIIKEESLGGWGNWKKFIPLFTKMNLPKLSRVSLTSIIRNWLISNTTHLHLALNFPKIQLFHYLKEKKNQKLYAYRVNPAPLVHCSIVQYIIFSVSSLHGSIGCFGSEK